MTHKEAVVCVCKVLGYQAKGLVTKKEALDKITEIVLSTEEV